MSPPLLDYTDLHRIFNSLDKNKDGKLTLDSLSWLLDQIGAQATRDDLQLLLLNGDLTFDEFVHFYESTVMVNSSDQDDEEEEKYLLEAFKVFDLNGDGLISPDEIGHVLRRLGLWKEDQGQMDCAMIVRAYDTNSDGFVDFEEFKKMMLNSLLS